MNVRRTVSLQSPWAAITLVAAIASTSAAQTRTQDPKPLAFDVVSIRENKSPPVQGPPDFGPTPDGYRSMNQSLILPLLTAYPPADGGVFFSNDRVVGLPDWMRQERYDLSAKVGEADMAEWQKPASQKVMLPAMLEAMFRERCKILVHRETKESSVSFLTVSKGGPKFKETNPDEAHAGVTLPGGGIAVPDQSGMKMYGISMATIAAFLTQMGGGSGAAIVDKTGLTGKYDVEMRMREGTASDREAMVSIMLDELGLKLESGKAPLEKLVIDHMERPSPN
jgi:uncharacterized protein (TIGR03435 family)